MYQILKQLRLAIVTLFTAPCFMLCSPSLPSPASSPASSASSASPLIKQSPRSRAISEGQLKYPEEWISKSLPRPNQICSSLVYKDGCREIRRGEMTFLVTLREDGHVARISMQHTTIELEPHVIERCFREHTRSQVFTPPGDYKPSFSLTIKLADRC